MAHDPVFGHRMGPMASSVTAILAAARLAPDRSPSASASSTWRQCQSGASSGGIAPSARGYSVSYCLAARLGPAGPGAHRRHSRGARIAALLSSQFGYAQHSVPRSILRSRSGRVGSPEAPPAIQPTSVPNRPAARPDREWYSVTEVRQWPSGPSRQRLSARHAVSGCRPGIARQRRAIRRSGFEVADSRGESWSLRDSRFFAIGY
jgi:hypothetical protein